jgi:aromatic-L-amino-acid decarboxylase
MAIKQPAAHDSRELELSADTMRRLIDQAMDRIVEHLETLPAQKVSDVVGGEELARSLVEGIPERSTPYAQILDLLFDRLVPKTLNTASPGIE